MQFISDRDLSEFFSNRPLYSKVKFLEINRNDEQVNVYDFLASKGHKDFCQDCKESQTFRFEKKYGDQLLLTGNLGDFVLSSTGNVDFSFNISSTCQFCGSKKDFFIKIYSAEKKGTQHVSLTFYLQKIGQFPSLERKPENEVYNYLSAEDKELYGKALTSLSVGYGIGAFAYFRRIVENEIKRIVEDLSNLDYEHADSVKKAWKTYKGNFQMSGLMDAISASLPISFKEVSGNPLKVLYQQVSEGIHDSPDDECLEKSIHIDKLLQFVIKRTSNLKSEIKDLHNAMKSLSKSKSSSKWHEGF